MTEVTSNVEVADMSEFFEHTLQTLIQAGQVAKAKAVEKEQYVREIDYSTVGLQVPRGLGGRHWLIERFLNTPNSFFFIQERIARAELIESHIDRIDSNKVKSIICANDFNALNEPLMITELETVLLGGEFDKAAIDETLDKERVELNKDLGYIPPNVIYILRPGEFFNSVRHAKFTRWLKALSERSKALHGKPYTPIVISLTEGD